MNCPWLLLADRLPLSTSSSRRQNKEGNGMKRKRRSNRWNNNDFMFYYLGGVRPVCGFPPVKLFDILIFNNSQYCFLNCVDLKKRRRNKVIPDWRLEPGKLYWFLNVTKHCRQINNTHLQTADSAGMMTNKKSCPRDFQRIWCPCKLLDV